MSLYCAVGIMMLSEQGLNRTGCGGYGRDSILFQQFCIAENNWPAAAVVDRQALVLHEHGYGSPGKALPGYTSDVGSCTDRQTDRQTDRHKSATTPGKQTIICVLIISTV